MNESVEYRVRTWDMNIEQFTPQSGVSEVVTGVLGVRKALRQLQNMGYQATRSDSSVLVELISPQKHE